MGEMKQGSYSSAAATKILNVRQGMDGKNGFISTKR